MGLANIWQEWKYNNVTIISPNDTYHPYIFEVIRTFNHYEINIPNHTVILYPDYYNINQYEVPVTYFLSKTIMLFPLNNTGGLMYQYFHELGHLLIGSSPKDNKWLDEIIACSCNFFLYPKERDYYLNYIFPCILSLQQNRENYQKLGNKLIEDPSLVYTSDTHIESLLYAYAHENNFDFPCFLIEMAKYRNYQEKRMELIVKLKEILLGCATTH